MKSFNTPPTQLHYLQQSNHLHLTQKTLHFSFSVKTPTDRSSDERWRVSDVVEAFSFDEVSHSGREVMVVSLNIVLQDQTAERASGLVLKGKAAEDEDKEMFKMGTRWQDTEILAGDKQG